MNIGNIVKRAFGTSALFVRKHASLIELVAGDILVTAGAVKLIQDCDKISEAKELKDSGEATKTEVAEAYVKATWKGVALVAGGVVMTGVSHATIADQLKVATTTLAATSLSYDNYRKRVIEDQGEEKDHEYLTGDGIVKTVEMKEDGTTVETTIPVRSSETMNREYIPHSFFFDESSNPNWTKDPIANRQFLESVERWVNQELEGYGFITENMIRKAVGAPFVKAGQWAGTPYKNPDGTVNHITFGMEKDTVAAQRFRDGIEPSFLVEIRLTDGRPLKDDISGDVDWSLV